MATGRCRRSGSRGSAIFAARMGLVVVLVLAGLLAGAAGALAYTFPPLTGRVVDAANVLDPVSREELQARLVTQEEETTDQLVVATVPSLEGGSIEDYANELFRAWRIGQADKNNGVLLLVAPNEREVRIEVGYGLEGILTDAVASTIIRNVIVPAFKAGDLPDGILKGTDAIIEILNLDPEEARARARAAEAENEMTLEDWLALALMVGIVALVIYLAWRDRRSGGGGGRRRRRRSDDGPSFSSWGGDDDRGSGGWSGGGGSSGGGGASGRW